MLTVLVAGVFSVLVLLIQGALTAGTRESRRRRRIKDNVELLEALPAAIDIPKRLLQEAIARDVFQLARDIQARLPREPVPKSAAPETRRVLESLNRERTSRRLALMVLAPLAVAVSVLSLFLVTSESEASSAPSDAAVNSAFVFFFVLLILSLIISVRSATGKEDFMDKIRRKL